MATPAEQDLVLAEAESNKERAQMFGILRLQEDKSAAGEKVSAAAMKSGDGRWQAPIFALARKASETFSGGIHVLPKVTEPKTSPFSEEWGAKAFRDPMAMERANLLNMAKLSIKGLIESALSFGRTLDSDYPPLQQFFVVMEHCLKHGLKVKKSFLGYNKSLWGPLEMVEKLCPEAGEIAASVRDLPGLNEFYENSAVMLEEEGAVIVGLLVGLNVIDANLCVKGEDLDTQVGVIDFSMYLKNDIDDDYRSEESSTVQGLQGRVESLEKSNSKLIEEIAEGDLNCELDTYKQSRQGLDEMYNEARRQLKEECQLRQSSDDSMRQKNDMIARLEEKTNQITATMKQLEQRLQDAERERACAEDGMRKFKQDFTNKADSLLKQIAQREKQMIQLETDLKIERDWRQTLQNELERERETITQLTAEAQQINGLKKEFHRLQDENTQLKGICEEQEQALEELGCKLSESKLKIEDIKEANKALQGGQVWLKDKDATHCKLCEKEFSISRRKHHCRNCGEIFCKACSDNELPLPASPKPVRVCDTCHALLLQRCSSNAT
ncbi:hypothetical protein cypCar_00001701 [Cyprinus carpio]|nr:hypothetical protein cypCar_00001701 [Cyprinus carpio]